MSDAGFADAMYDEIYGLNCTIGQLTVENAKLRELVAAMPYCMEARCLECPMCSSFDTSIGGAPECRASWKLRELGVDV